MNQQVGRTLRETADLIEKCGWLTFNFGSIEKGFCVIGAMNYALTGDASAATIEVNAAANALWQWLCKHTERPVLCIPHWNDKQAESQEEVVAILRKAADDLDPVKVYGGSDD